MGFAAVQMALLCGARVIATAGKTSAIRLRGVAAAVTPYGDGMVGRVLGIAGATPDLVLDTAPVGGALPALVETAGGDPRRVLIISDLAAAARLSTRSGVIEDTTLRYDVLGDFARLVVDGRFVLPVARTHALEDWRTALDVSLSGRARGKFVLLPRLDTRSGADGPSAA